MRDSTDPDEVTGWTPTCGVSAAPRSSVVRDIMRTIEQAPDRLIVHDSPWGVRAIGALLAVLGTAVLVDLMTGGRAEHGAWVGFVVGGTFAAMGTAVALTATDCRLIFDGPGMLVRMVRRGMFGATTTTYPFSSIRDIALEVSGVGRGTPTSGFYRSVFVLRDGTRVPWTLAATGDFGSQARCVAAVRSFGGWDTAASNHSGPDSAGPTGPRRPTPLTAGSTTSFPGDPPRVGAPPRVQNAQLVGVVLGVFALVGVGMTVMEAERLVAWRPVPAVVQSTTVQGVRGAKGSTSYRPVVTYRYAVNGRTYASSDVNVITVSRSYAWAQSVTTHYAPGATTTAYVNPRDPRHAYLVHEFSLLPLWITLIPAFFGAIFLYGTRWNERQAALAAGVTVPILASPGTAAGAA
jgi:Protein of unknown function (DUF3592)